MAIAFRGVNNAAGQNAGVTTPAGTTSISVSLPGSTVIRDRVFIIECGSNTSGTAPADWNLLGTKDTVIGSGAVAAAGGLRYMTVYWRDYDGQWSMPALTLTSATQNSHWVGAVSITPTAGSVFNTPTISTVGGAFNAATTSYTDTSAASFTTTSNGFLIVGTCLNDNVTASAGAVTQSGATFGAVTERCDGGTATGNDVAGKVFTCSVTTGASATITHTETISAASQGETLFIQQTERAADAIATLTDNATTFDSTKWFKTSGVGAGVSGGTFVVPITTAYQRIFSKDPYNLTGSSLIVEVPTPTMGSGIYTDVGLRTVSGDYQNAVFYGFWSGGVTVAGKYVAGVETSDSDAYNATNHRWVKISESGGTIYFHTAPDGVTWTQQYTTTVPFAITALFVDFQAGCGAGTPGNALYDNVNLPAPAGTIASTAQAATASMSGSQAAGSADGTIAASIPPATAALAGSQDQTGTIAASAQKATASLTGVMEPSGTVAAALQKALFAGTATQTQTGTIAATLQMASASLTGTMQPSGTVAAALQKALFAGTATQTQTGTVAAVLQAATASLTGTVQPTGTVAATLQQAAFAGTATQTQTGAIASTAQAATASFTGVMVPSGTVVAAAQPAVFAGSGTQTQTGAVAATLQPALFSGTGAQTQAGAVAATLQKATASLTGAMQPSGTVAASLQKALFAATATQTQTGTIAASAQKATASLTGVMAPSGVVAAAAQRLAFDGSGSSAPPPGTMAGSLEPAVAGLSGAMQPSGQIAASLRAATFNGSGVQAQSGAIAAALTRALYQATGEQPQSGVIAAVLASALYQAVGEQAQTGTLSSTLQPLSADLAGDYALSPEGSLTSVLVPPVMSAEGIGGISSGTISATVSAVLFAGLLKSYRLAQDRLTVVSVDNRTSTVVVEPRTSIVVSEPRTSVVVSKPRTSTIAVDPRTTEVSRGNETTTVTREH